MHLAQKTCTACEGGAAPLSREEAEELRQQTPLWQIQDDAHVLMREFGFPDFAHALAFVNAVGTHAEAEGHHPDIELSWGRVRIALTTHAIHGLSENDFILAAKIDTIQ